MPMPAGPVTLSTEQIQELQRKLGTMRHDINNNLSLIVAAVELIKFNPAAAERMMATLSEQPHKITEHVQSFSAEFEKALGIVR
ncbi:MAG: hypothetical protein RJA22_2430 [Verrucomicrobiota bacterium]|jgi:Cu/Ag efflux protein CusF